MRRVLNRYRVTKLPAAARGWQSRVTCIDAAHTVHARVEDRIRTGKDCGTGHFPSRSLSVNTAWLTASLLTATLLAWLRHLALDGALVKAEPKALRYRVLHAAARLVRGARRRQLRIPATWPRASDITAAWQQITALPQAPDQQARTRRPGKDTIQGPVEPPAPGPPAGQPAYPDTRKGLGRPPRQPQTVDHQPRE
jgi:hypothetical protein